MNASLQSDFVIVGGGIAGLSVAYELSKRGSVIVLEQEEHPGYHSTGRSAAVFADSYGTSEIRALSACARQFFEQPPFPNHTQPLLSPRGLLHLVRRESTPESLTRAHDLSAARALCADEVLALVPLLNPEVIVNGYLESTVADIDVHALQTGYVNGLIANGGRLLRQARVQTARRSSGRWFIDAGLHEVESQIVVNASGAWADGVGAVFGAEPIGLIPTRRTAALVDAPAGFHSAKWPMVIDTDQTIYFKPDAGKIMISPIDQTHSDPCDAYPEDIDVATAVDRFEKLTTREVMHVSHTWAGLRTFSADNNPVIGFDRRVADFFWLAGQGGVGVQTAPAAAMLAAALIWDDARQYEGVDRISIEKLSPGRFVHHDRRQ